MHPRGKKSRCPKNTQEHPWLLVPSLSSSRGCKLMAFQNTRQIVVPLREHRNETSSGTLYTVISIKKLDCSGNVHRSNLKDFCFLFLYIDINYNTTTREIKNSSFFLYMMNVSNHIKVRKVTQTTGAHINAPPT